MQSNLERSGMTLDLPAARAAGLPADALGALETHLGIDRDRLRRLAGIAALGLISVGVIAAVLFAAAGSGLFTNHPANPLHPKWTLFPSWESGPLARVLPRPLPRHHVMLELLTWSTVALVALYLAAVACAKSLTMRQVWLFVGFTGLVLLLGPPGRLNDVFNYLGYARLGAVHGLNPYTHVIGAERGDPVFWFTSWRNLASPYGPLFTALSYPLALLPLAAAYWLMKALIIAASFGFLYCVYRCALLLGRDPRRVVLFVAANPLYLFYEVAGFHNDFLMLLPSTAAMALILARRERAAGAAIALAIAVKFTTVVLLPFLLLAAWRNSGRWRRVLEGAVIAAVPLIVMDVALFGFSLPNVSDQSGLVTGYSIPNLVGIALGFGGGTQTVVRLFELAIVLVVLVGLRRRDWITGAGWAQLAFVAGLAWLMPWYLVWALPLAALAQSAGLRRAVLVFTLFLLVTFLPATGPFLAKRGFDPAKTRLGRIDSRYEMHLQWQHLPPPRYGRRHSPPVIRVRQQTRSVAPPDAASAAAFSRSSATIAHRCSGCSRSEAPIA